MAQHDYNLANQSGADFRADLNNALSAIVTVNSGATAPSTTFSHQLWVDTSSNVLKIRNAANDAWVTTGVSITADNTFAGNLTGNVTGNLTGDVTGNADTATALETARTINGASFDGTANISFDTDSVSEGSSNLYYTSARFDTRLATKDTDDLTEGTNLYYTDARSRAAISATGDISYNSTTGVISFTETTAPVTSVFGRTGVVVATTGDYTTAQVTESGNLYYTDARVQAVSINNVAEDTTPQLGGNLSSNGNDINFGDNDKAIFGTGSDLEIYHSGTHSIIADVGTGDLLLRGNNARLQNSDGSATFIHGFNGGEVQINYAGNTKLATTSTGIDVTGTTVTDGLTVNSGDTSSFLTIRNGSNSSFTKLYSDLNGVTVLDVDANNVGSSPRFQIDVSEVQALRITEGGDISFYDDTGTSQNLKWDASADTLNFVDNAKATFGAGNDLQIYHTGSHSYIDSYTGNLHISSDSLQLKSKTGGENYIRAFLNGAVDIYYDNSAKLATTSTGIDVTGTVTSDGLTVDGNVVIDGLLQFEDSGGSNRTVMEYDSNDDVLIKTGTSSGSRSIRFQTEASEVMRIDANARVGIGTTAPSSQLHLAKAGGTLIKLGTSINTSEIEAREVGGGQSLILSSVNSADHLVIDGAGRVGIGTDSPNYLLDVEGSGSLLRVNSTSGDSNIDLRVADTTSLNIINFGDSGSSNAGRILYRHSGDSMAFNVAGSEAVRIINGGNIGIGTSSPDGNLEVVASTTVSGASDSVNNVLIGLQSTNRPTIILDTADTTYTNRTWNITNVGSAGTLRIGRNGLDVMSLKNDGKIGIGTDSPNARLDVNGGLNSTHAIFSGQGGRGLKISTQNTLNNDDGVVYDAQTSTGKHLFKTGGTERARLDSSGNLLVGKTAASSYTAGFQTGQDGFTAITRALYSPLVVNRLTNDGTIIDIRKDSTTVGSIETATNTNTDISVGSDDIRLLFFTNGSAIIPRAANNGGADDTIDLGGGSNRFQDIYATNATIQTSDINEKQDIEDLSEAETRVAVAAKGLLKKYRWKSAVADKGDDARIHFGIMAQDLQQAFSAEGLDAGDYGMFISSTWTDETTGEEKTRLGVRYNELLAFIIAAI